MDQRTRDALEKLCSTLEKERHRVSFQFIDLERTHVLAEDLSLVMADDEARAELHRRFPELHTPPTLEESNAAYERAMKRASHVNGGHI